MAVAAATVAAAGSLLERAGVAVRVVDAQTRRVLWATAAEAGQPLELRYTHSVERTPVIEVYRAEPDGLWFESMRFFSQGAGLPTEGYVREGEAFVLRARRRVGALVVRVSRVAGHRLAVGSTRLDLVALARDGAALSIESRPGPLRLRRVRW